ncbi:glycerophosphodiester phosphodiesterase family protein [Pararhizobium sp.]|uniref:glycerophosphodiester phosphodiesterase family protein n=1 Tax=Pararhizobium sp. TaxID=1977563 RepID=UPI00272268FE|nr:glycerophosphodiester phosphodiesterase family protein [Pararhizobium sp.]MDO9415602.1 glycerophosphodiester phosphodiesterase family protein [Pararhizobium sp.]
MRWTAAIVSALIMTCMTGSGSAADTVRTSQILSRLTHANDWRNHVMVVAHRTGWKENGKFRFADNSLAAIRNSIALGAEMLELDVRKSADGVLILMHDSWLDRTTDCKGEVDKRTLAELKRCRLVNEGTRIATDESIPTLEEALLTTRGQILVNIDNKLEADALPDIAATARDLGMADQILMKQNVWNAARIADTKAVLAKVGNDVPFMPILADDAVHDERFMVAATRAFAAPAAELVHWQKDGDPLTVRGGPLFTAKARAAAIAGNWHLWVNVYGIVNRPDGMLSGGRGDALAMSRPDEVYGFWIDRGVTIIQTDEPKAAIAWLDANGYRIPYDLTN